MTLEEQLAELYTKSLQGQHLPALAKFMQAIAADPILEAATRARLVELDSLAEARGEGACAYSTEYRNYLHEALE